MSDGRIPVRSVTALAALLIALTAASCKCPRSGPAASAVADAASVEEVAAPTGAAAPAAPVPPAPPAGEHQCPYAAQAQAQGQEPAHTCPHAAAESGGHTCPHRTTAGQEPSPGAPAAKGDKLTCPIGGEVIEDPGKAFKSAYKGKTYYFGCEGCKQKFDADPEKYAGAGPK